MEERVQAVLDRIRPALKRDGGDVELVSVEGNVVKLRLIGSCSDCAMSTLTLQQVVEKAIKQEIPEIEYIESVE